MRTATFICAILFSVDVTSSFFLLLLSSISLARFISATSRLYQGNTFQAIWKSPLDSCFLGWMDGWQPTKDDVDSATIQCKQKKEGGRDKIQLECRRQWRRATSTGGGIMISFCFCALACLAFRFPSDVRDWLPVLQYARRPTYLPTYLPTLPRMNE